MGRNKFAALTAVAEQTVLMWVRVRDRLTPESLLEDSQMVNECGPAITRWPTLVESSDSG
jgi:hypothetical protein